MDARCRSPILRDFPRVLRRRAPPRRADFHLTRVSGDEAVHEEDDEDVGDQETGDGALATGWAQGDARE